MPFSKENNRQRPRGHFFWKVGSYFHTQKGYINIDLMIYWVENILNPYVNMVRLILGENLRYLLIGDGLKAYFHSKIDQSFQENGNIKVIPLPLHSSHISQMLDSTPFVP